MSFEWLKSCTCTGLYDMCPHCVALERQISAVEDARINEEMD